MNAARALRFISNDAEAATVLIVATSRRTTAAMVLALVGELGAVLGARRRKNEESWLGWMEWRSVRG